jgi:hypothetical protein
VNFDQIGYFIPPALGLRHDFNFLHFLRDLLLAEGAGRQVRDVTPQLKSKSGRGALDLKHGEPVTVGADAPGLGTAKRPQKRRQRGREAGPGSECERGAHTSEYNVSPTAAEPLGFGASASQASVRLAEKTCTEKRCFELRAR